MISLLILAAALLAAAPAPGPTSDTLELFVSPSGDDAWSGRRAEPEGAAGPFATLARARDEVRRLEEEGRLPTAVVVRLREGRHRLSAPLVFTPEDSGPGHLGGLPG